VLAQRVRLGHGYSGAVQRAVDPVLARHVVGCGEEVPQRRATHDEPAPCRLDAQGQVRAAAGDDIHGKRLTLELEVVAQPCPEPVPVKVVAHRPWYLGGRFSMKAATPSLWSSVANSSARLADTHTPSSRQSGSRA